jgi:hypothetical protein
MHFSAARAKKTFFAIPFCCVFLNTLVAKKLELGKKQIKFNKSDSMIAILGSWERGIGMCLETGGIWKKLWDISKEIEKVSL